MRINTSIKLISIFVLLMASALSHAFTEIADPKELRGRLGLNDISPLRQDLSNIKVAVLDNCFAGFQPGKGMLPDSAEYVEGPLVTSASCSHGLGMAQILWAMSGQKAYGPKIYLINSNGFTNFKAAVDFVIKNKVDIVLYSQVWLFGSNFDGKGFINEVVNKATNAGVIWINAAGNLGSHVYHGPVGKKQKLEINNKLDENNFTVTLTWNDFSSSEETCTKKDLDLQILDSRGNIIKTAELVQSGSSPDLQNPNDRRSCYARESLSLVGLERGTYYAKVKSKSNNFNSNDSFRVIITDDRPGSLEFKDRTVGHEIMPPADNAQVITVGEKSETSAVGPTADGRIKPDVLIENSKVNFTNGNQTAGSSNAAAMMAGATVIMKAMSSGLTWQKILNYSRSLGGSYLIPSGLVVNSMAPLALRPYLTLDGVIAVHTGTNRYVLLSKQHPSELAILSRFNLRIVERDDIVACDYALTSCAVYEKSQDHLIRPPMIEFRQLVQSQGQGQILWRLPPHGIIQ